MKLVSAYQVPHAPVIWTKDKSHNLVGCAYQGHVPVIWSQDKNPNLVFCCPVFLSAKKITTKPHTIIENFRVWSYFYSFLDTHFWLNWKTMYYWAIIFLVLFICGHLLLIKLERRSKGFITGRLLRNKYWCTVSCSYYDHINWL